MKALILLTLLNFSILSFAQTSISGIINSYIDPTNYNICTNTATIPSSSGISIGDYVLIIQMKGVEINQNNNTSYGDIINYGSAGLYEVAQVSSLTTNTITFVHPLLNSYDFNSNVQFVVCPNYTNVTVTSQLSALPWNGSTGGVLFLYATSVNLSANLDVSNLGFRGGLVSDNYYSASNCTTTDYTTTSLLGAYKGEGVFSTSSSTNFGRGKNANGGGGGNNINAGGAGGGNGGAGGKGGNQWTGCGNNAIGGIGGGTLDCTNRIFLGGGGGGGHQNNDESTQGGNGGGIIILKSDILTTNGFSINSNGQAVSTIAGTDAAGGGGSGGSVFIQSNTVSGALNIELQGGNGGSSNNNFSGGSTGGQCHGTGGGGGGGTLILNLGNTPTLNSNLIGGIGGINTNTQSNCYNQNFGSENGQDGIIITDQIIPENNNSTSISGLSVSAVITNNECSHSNSEGSISLSVVPMGQYNFNWTHDPTLNSPNAIGLSSGDYAVTISDGNCTKDTIFTIIYTPEIQDVEFSIQEIDCFQNGSININEINGGTSPFETSLNGNSFSQTLNYTNLVSGTYSLEIKDSNNCLLDTTFQIIENPNSINLVINIDSNCDLEQTNLTVSASSLSSVNFTFNFDNNLNTTGYYPNVLPGNYNLTITDDQGCSIDTAIQIYPFNTMDSILFSTENEYCGNSNGTFVIHSFYGDFNNPVFSFQNNVITQGEIITGLTSGNYTLIVSDLNGCLYDTNVYISLTETAPFLISYSSSLPSCDQKGVVHINEINGGFAPYLISYNGNSPTTNTNFLYSENGTLNMEISDQTGCSFQYTIPLIGNSEIETVFIPNCFTPDGDEFNNYWFTKGNCIEDFKCIIFNRWGQIVFEYYDISAYWDGTYNNTRCVDGIYFYKVNINYKSGKKDEFHGHITLIR